MPKCSMCGKETELHVGGSPICPKCSAELESPDRQPRPDPRAEENQLSYT